MHEEFPSYTPQVPSESQPQSQVERSDSSSPREKFYDLSRQLLRFADVRLPEGSGNISEVFLDALSLLPEAAKQYLAGRGAADAAGDQAFVHNLALMLYKDAIKAAQMQGNHVHENDIVITIASQGLIAETLALLNLAKRPDTNGSV